jgi:hypothetical protein
MAANPAVDRMQEPGLIHFGSRRPGDRCRLASPIQLPAALARNFRRAVTLSRHALPSGQLALPRKNHRSRQARCPPPSLAVHQNHLGLSSRPALQTCAPRVTGSFRRQPKRIHECPGLLRSYWLQYFALPAARTRIAAALPCLPRQRHEQLRQPLRQALDVVDHRIPAAEDVTDVVIGLAVEVDAVAENACGRGPRPTCGHPRSTGARHGRRCRRAGRR